MVRGGAMEMVRGGRDGDGARWMVMVCWGVTETF